MSYKMTVLEMVQDILSDMDGDEVSAITDSVESNQVTNIIKNTYFEIISKRYWSHLETLGQLTGLADLSYPNYFILDDTIQKVQWFRYNVIENGATVDVWRDIKYLEPKVFLDWVNDRDNTDTNLDEITDHSGVTLQIWNERGPTYWTTFNDEHIVCDAYDSAVESTLQGSKTHCLFLKEPTWTDGDGTYVPDLPSKAFPYLLAEAKSTAFYNLRQSANEKEEQKSKRQRNWLAREQRRIGGGIKYYDYGRKG